MNFVDLGGLGWLVAGIIFGMIIRHFLPSYLAEKGKNFATKEDIGTITREVERVRHEYAERFESLSFQNRQIIAFGDRRNQLRLAALERRLEIHQQAYTLWVKLVQSVFDRQAVFKVAAECQEWWMSHCLYLEAEPRAAFRQAYMVATDHHELVRNRESADLVKQSWATIWKVGELIDRAVELPPIVGVGPELQKQKSQGDA